MNVRPVFFLILLRRFLLLALVVFLQYTAVRLYDLDAMPACIACLVMGMVLALVLADDFLRL